MPPGDASAEPPVMGRPLLAPDAAVWLCAAWVAAWLASHFLWQFCQPRDPYSRRLWRSQAYCCLAVVGGARLLWRCQRFPDDLLNDFSLEHQVLFAMAVGHWLVSIPEDWRSWQMLGRGLDKKVLRCRDPSLLLLRAYTVHHLAAAGGFFALLQIRRCSGVGAFGLLFELPVLLLNRRELALSSSPTPRWLQQRSRVAEHWRNFGVLFLLARGGPAMVYVYSLVFWRQQLTTLTAVETAVYHGLAVFFSLLNHLFVNVLLAWARSDLFALEVDSGLVEEEAGGAMEVGEEGFAVDPEAAPLREVSVETLASMTGAAPGQKVWVAVEGAAYDVTEFLASDCPCGEQVLRKWAGQDASEPFRAAGHSARARAQMLRYMVGPVRYPHTEYRIFEHEEEEGPVAKVVTRATFSYGVKVAVVSGLLLGVPRPEQAGGLGASAASGGASVTAVPGLALQSLLLAAVTGMLAVPLTMATKTVSVSRGWGEHVCALTLLLYHYCFLGGCQGPPLGFPSGAPDGIELCAGILLVVEAAREQDFVQEFDKSVGFWGAACAVLYSWLTRAVAPQQTGENWGSTGQRYFGVLRGYSDLLGRAVVLACALSFVLHRANPSGRGRDQSAAAAVMGRALRLSGLYGLLGILALATASPAVGAEVDVLLAAPGDSAVRFLAAGAASLALLSSLLGATVVCSPAFASRAAAFALAAVSVFFGGLSGRRWLTAAGFLTHLAGLAARNRIRLHEAAAAKRFGDLPGHVIGAQALWDHVRVVLGSYIWRLTVLRWQALINMFLPRELRLFASETVFPNVGRPEDKTYLGVAAHFAPRRARGQKQMPQYFVCNVGQIHHNALNDMQRTMNTLIDCWQEFQEPDMKGLLANVVAVFPDVEDQMVAKEINLSAWESAKDAHTWYMKSPGHRNAMFQHSSGILRTFGNLLASLEPVGSLRHQDRCRRCARLVESREPGQLAPSRCGVCGGPTFRYPVF